MSPSSFPLFNKSRDTTNHFSHLHLSNSPLCTFCGCRGFINSSAPSGSHKRPCSENPSAYQSKPKKPNNIAMVVETTHSPTANPMPSNAFSNANAWAKLPPRPPALRRSVPDPMPSPANTFSTSSESPNPEWLRKKNSCTREMSRKWDELSDFIEDSTKAELSRDNSGEIINEAVSVEKIGEALIIHFLCPCGAGYQILLLGGDCYYMLTQM